MFFLESKQYQERENEAYESSSDNEIVSNNDLCQLYFEKYTPTKKQIKKISWHVPFVINGTIKTA